MGDNYDRYERCVMECKWLEECVMDVSVAMYGHAKVEGMGLKDI